MELGRDFTQDCEPVVDGEASAVMRKSPLRGAHERPWQKHRQALPLHNDSTRSSSRTAPEQTTGHPGRNPMPPVRVRSAGIPCAPSRGQRQPLTCARQRPTPPNSNAPVTTHPSTGETPIPEKLSSDKPASAIRHKPTHPSTGGHDHPQNPSSDKPASTSTLATKH
jgi:hypothetical protein